MNDNYKEHELHNIVDKNCSTCFSENKIILDKVAQDKLTKVTMDFFSNLWKTQVKIAESLK